MKTRVTSGRLRTKKFSIIVSVLSLLVVSGSALAAAGGAHVQLRLHELDPSFNPNAPVGGVPFCTSGSLGTILCYPPNFIRTAYNFPPTTGRSGLDGSGQTIVIVDAFGSPTVQADLDTFDATFGVSPTTVKVLCGPTWTGAATDNCPVKTIADLTGAPNAVLCAASGWASETTLDVTMSHALAPGAKIVLVVADDCFDSNIIAAEKAVVEQRSFRGSIMSQSFGEADDLVGCVDFPTCTMFDTTRADQDAVYKRANRNDWTLIASSGDDGANEDAREAGTLELTPGWPASNPLVLAAGGTQGHPYGGQYGGPPGPGLTFACAAHEHCNTGLVIIDGGENGCGTAARPGVPSSCTPLRYGGEGAWNEAAVFGSLGYSTGGGVSAAYGVPFYQEEGLPEEFTTVLGATVRASGRLNPDVSFNASVYGGWLAYRSFIATPAWAVFGGTSAASPAWAGIVALLNQANGGPVGFIAPQIYDLAHREHRSGFHDIKFGNNQDAGGALGEDGFSATRGYDLTTGWGTVDVSEIIRALTD